MSKKRNIVIGSLLLIFLIAVVGLVAVNHLESPVDSKDEEMYLIEIPSGFGVTQIASLLEKEGLIRNGFFFRIYSRVNQYEGKMKEGEYLISPSMSTSEIIDKIVRGDVLTYQFTIPEGYTVQQIAELLDRKGFADKQQFLIAAREINFDLPFPYKLPQVKEPLEGYLFPDTYSYAKDMDETDLILVMLNEFEKLITSEIKDRAQELGYSMQEVITIASLIEREAQLADERRIISSVIHNRLDIGMRLGLCASVMYVLPEPKDSLTYADLEIDSPYNTYRNDGLPPGPIASPGRESILAALYPDDTSYYYFVARGDGSHVFTRTLAEHNKAISEIRGN